jgi:hypothetical protein
MTHDEVTTAEYLLTTVEHLANTLEWWQERGVVVPGTIIARLTNAVDRLDTVADKLRGGSRQ